MNEQQNDTEEMTAAPEEAEESRNAENMQEAEAEAASEAVGEKSGGAHPPAGKTKLVTNQGVTADEYCVSDPWIDSSRLSDEEEEELSGILIEYDMKKEEIVPAMKAFQNKVSLRKNLLYTAVLAVLAVLYYYQVWNNPDYNLGKVLGSLCLFVILMIWYLPGRHIKATVQAIESDPMTYRLEISEVGFLILENGGKYLVRYSTPSVSVIELPNVFTVCVSKEKVFIIPKRCVPEDKLSEVRKLMQDGLKERYVVKEK